MNRILNAARRLTTPLLPSDFLELVNPMWSGSGRAARVISIIDEAPGAATLQLRPARPLPAHLAGQHLPIGVDVRGVRTWRTYSITSPAGGAAADLCITVKAVDAGVVSNYLVNDLEVGDLLWIGEPSGEFHLPTAQPQRLLMVAAGGGITPIMGMLLTLANQPNPPLVELVTVDHSRSDQIFGAELRELASSSPWLKLHVRYTSISGRQTFAEITDQVPDWQELPVWVCGPAGLLEQAQQHWDRCGDPSQLNIERFTPVRAATVGQGGNVTFERSTRQQVVGADTTVLEAGEAAGILMPHGCRMGICHGCVVPLVEGQVRDIRTGQTHGEPNELIQTCINAPLGDVHIDI